MTQRLRNLSILSMEFKDANSGIGAALPSSSTNNLIANASPAQIDP